jgi:Peptide N-acetyl-beta-D-glucosaminyl asparaginase amidase A
VLTKASNLRFRLALSFLSIAIFAISAAAQIGSGNTYTADPPIPHPATKPCVVPLFKEVRFADFNPKSFSYAPPANCAGPWAKVILIANFSVTKGIQFDRTANLWLGATNIYFGTTAEPSPTLSPHWQIQRDLTDYSSILTTPQTGTADIGNLVNSTYTGVIFGSASLYFYPPAPGQVAPTTADQVIPFSAGPTGGTVALPSTTSLLAQTLTLPTNIQQVYFDVFAQSQNADEFWYACVPNDVSAELFSCPGTSFRESEVTIDGTPAGVAPVYPWIYTGGIDPFLWAPIPGVQTLKLVPYRVNLTPFAGLLDDGQPHTIALSVFNADNYFSATASLLLYLNHNVTQLTGAVTTNTLALPNPTAAEHLHTASNGNITGNVSTRAGHQFQIDGYVNTPSGPVTTSLSQDINFSNYQTFHITSTLDQQDITQRTAIRSITTTHNGKNIVQVVENNEWPLTANISLVFNADGTINQTTSIQQAFQRDFTTRLNGAAESFSEVNNQVSTTDDLQLNSSFQIIGNSNQSSSQKFFASDSAGYCFSREIAASANVLTTIVNGDGCRH